MNAERAELRRTADEPADDRVSSADVRRRPMRRQDRPWPPAWFGAAIARRHDTAARAGDGFGG